MKLVIIVGTRPEIIRLSATINLSRKLFDVTLIHTGQNYDTNLNEIFFKDLEIDPPDIYLDCSKKNCCDTVGDIISKTYELLKEIQPNAILILGDTNSCLSAYSAKRLKIPIFHLEAGNRSFDPNVPEEINRKIIDHLSDINICYMEHARNNLEKENCKPQYTFVAGSPMTEIYLNIKEKINKSKILDQYNLTQNEYFVWSSHREDNIDNEINFLKMIESLTNIEKKYKKKIIFGVHPRTQKKLDELNIHLSDNIILTKPFGLIDYYCLLQNSFCVISDSGTISEEANILKFKAILLRVSTEHPETIDSGSITMGNIDWLNLENALCVCLNSENIHNKIINYEDTNFSSKVCKIIVGYYEIINKFLWLKSYN
jgi:UDP-N-acetylglucosamine 2-epimerase (non-hydrolysing)